ncbi:MAG: NADP-dependent oxidoreductase [Bacillaceae bacterium]|nr:NADP-dependent oxidoreductase [Bacillaceae bacterium]
MDRINRQIHLKSRPIGMPDRENFEWVESPIPEPGENELLLRTLYLSVDPYMRGRMSDRKSYVPPYPLHDVIAGGVVAEVVESKSPDFKKGDIVESDYGWQTHAVVAARKARKLNPDLAPVTTALGTLGMPGLTAYFGLLDIGRPREGETVVISGAAGAVGMTVGQIAKLKGTRVVGIAGSDRKVQYLKEELGFDDAINYKTTENMREALKKTCPDGIDIYFDNVGGPVSDAALSLINRGARIPLCGQIALYNLEKPDVGPRIQSFLLINSALMKGFIVTDYAERFPEAYRDLTTWYREGKLKTKETIVEGFDNTVDAFLGLFKGENLGKQLVKV